VPMLVIGSRGSALALAQTEWTRSQILRRFPDIDISIKVIKTSADKDTTASIRAGSAVGVFVKELEQALLEGEIDLAVHSMKDLPTQIQAGLQIAAVPEREDALDALIAHGVRRLSDLPINSVIGTGSVRRQSQLLALRPDLRVMDIRGNIDTRLGKLEDGAYHAIVLACAGLNRLGLQKKISLRLDLSEMLPAPGQGALAIETRDGDSWVGAMVAALNHQPTATAVHAERAFLRKMGGGCNVPVAVHASIRQDMIEICGLVASPDGTKILRESVSQRIEMANEAAISLADRILAQGGREILDRL
jgi:hydroxymethylbilane synthase